MAKKSAFEEAKNYLTKLRQGAGSAIREASKQSGVTDLLSGAAQNISNTPRGIYNTVRGRQTQNVAQYQRGQKQLQQAQLGANRVFGSGIDPATNRFKFTGSGAPKVALTAAGTLFPAARTSALLGGGIGGGYAALTRQNIGKGIGGGATMGLQANTVSGITNPLISRVLPKGTGLLASRLIPAGANVGQGILIDRATGQQTTPASIGIDLGVGLLGRQAQFQTPVKSVKGKQLEKLIPVKPTVNKPLGGMIAPAESRLLRASKVQPRAADGTYSFKVKVPQYVGDKIKNVNVTLKTDPTNPNRLIRTNGKLEGAYGVMAGFEPEYDETGKPTGKIKFNSSKAAAGIAVMGGIKAVKGNRVASDAFDQAISKTSKQVSESALEQATGVKSGLTDVRTQLIDKFAPVEVLTRKLRENGKLVAEKDPFKQARLFGGVGGKIDQEVSKLSPILEPVRQNLDSFRKLLIADRIEELSARGITKFPGGLNLVKAKQLKQEMINQLGQEGMAQLDNAKFQYKQLMDTNLKKLYDNGILSKESFDAIKSKNESYTPFLIAEYLGDNIDNVPLRSKSFNVASQDVIKGLQGSTKEIVDPLESSIRQIAKITNLVERNRVGKTLANLSNFEEMKDIVRVVDSDIAIPKGFDKVSFFDQGVKKNAIVPKEVADAMKGLNQESADLITKALSSQAKLLRAGATTYNVGFLIPNVIRDVTNAQVLAKHGLGNWFGGLFSAIRKDKDYADWVRSGGSGSTMSAIAKKPKSGLKELTGQKSIGKIIKTPITLLEELGRISEEATRVSVFKQARKKGESLAESAFQSRESTVDFGKSGNKLKLYNMWVPFLNARVQGTTNLVNSFKKNPVRTSARLTALVGLPAIGTYLYNRQFSDYQDLQQYEKDNNFIIMQGNRTTKEKEAGAPIKALKIPKGDVGKIFGNPIEAFMAHLDGVDSKSVGELAVQILGEVSPVGVTPRQVLSSVVPPVLKAGIEVVTNKNLFTGQDIEPQYIKGVPREQLPSELRIGKKTGKFAQAAGKITGKIGISPAQLENAAGTLAGGVGKQAFQVGNLLFGQTPTQKEMPVINRFVGGQGGALESQGFERAKQFSQEVGRQQYQQRDLAETIVSQVNSVSTRAEKAAILRQYKDQLTPEVITKIKNLNKKQEKYGGSVAETGQITKPAQQLNMISGNKNKATFIIQELNNRQTREEKNQYLLSLKNSGVLTKDLIKQIRNQNTGGK